MGAHRTNRKVRTGNRKDQQQALRKTWSILDPLTGKRRSYLKAQLDLEAWNKARLANPAFGVEPTIGIDPIKEGRARGHWGARLWDFVVGHAHATKKSAYGLGRRRKTRKEE
jgi:hypothetical protein